eukprot:COSAG02_NODE_19295_length_890_cov_0.911504_1_plen_42_part_10
MSRTQRSSRPPFFLFFFRPYNDPATTEIYTIAYALFLHHFFD